MAKRKNKEPEVTSWLVDVTVTLKGEAVVEAASEEEAMNATPILDQSFLATADMSDWEVHRATPNL